jgi:hypothetical protein
MQIRKFMNKCDYIIYGEKNFNDNEKTEVYKFKWNKEFICQRRMFGGDPKGYNRTLDEDDY